MSDKGDIWHSYAKALSRLLLAFSFLFLILQHFDHFVDKEVTKIDLLTFRCSLKQPNVISGDFSKKPRPTLNCKSNEMMKKSQGQGFQIGRHLLAVEKATKFCFLLNQETSI